MGNIWNVDYFDIVAPPLTLAKTIPKSYQTDTWGLFYSYKGHICTKCCIYLTNTSPIYHKNQGHISVIWIWEKSEKFRPPPSVKVSLHLKCRLFWLWRWPHPPLWTFSTIWDFFLDGSLYLNLWLEYVNVGKSVNLGITYQLLFSFFSDAFPKNIKDE